MMMEIPEPFLLWEVGRRVLDEPHQVGTPLEMLDELETPTGGFQSPSNLRGREVSAKLSSVQGGDIQRASITRSSGGCHSQTSAMMSAPVFGSKAKEITSQPKAR